MADLVAGGGVDGRGAVPGREVRLGGEPGDVCDLDQQPGRAGGADAVQISHILIESSAVEAVVERINDEQIAALVRFVYARISDTDSVKDESVRRAANALRLATDKQVAAVRYYRASSQSAEAVELHATSAWNLLVSIAQIWRDRVDFPADAAIETFEFDAENPLMS